MSEHPENYEDVTVYGLDDDVEEQLLLAHNECTFIWSNKEGWPVGVIMSYIWRNGRFWLTASSQRARIAAVRRDPRYQDTIGLEPGGSLRVDHDLERSDGPRGNGAENSVSDVLWDLTDGAPGYEDRDRDGVALGPEGILRAMIAMNARAERDGVPFGPAGTGATFSFTPTQPGVYVARLLATDGDGGQADDAVAVLVAAAVPAANIVGNPTPGAGEAVPEGTTITLANEVTDPFAFGSLGFGL